MTLADRLKVAIVYPVPLETAEVWKLFKPFVMRFCFTYDSFYPGDVEHSLVPVLNTGANLPDAFERVQEALQILDGLTMAGPAAYTGAGADIGSFQHAAKQFAENTFMVCCTSRVYFHRAGWLDQLLRARLMHGPGLYGTSASREGGRLHVCTRCYGMDSDIFKQYPHEIGSRDQGTFFEVGRDNPDGTLSDWFEKNHYRANIVAWDSIVPFRHFNLIRNGFRQGDQSNILVRDKHSDAFELADKEEKQRLSELCYGMSDICP